MRDVQLDGVCYPPNSSNKASARLIVHSKDQYELLIDSEIVQTGQLHDLMFSDRIGSTNRKIYFANGNQFETTDNDTVDHILKSATHKNHNTTIVNKLESSWTFALVSIVFTVLVVAGFFKFGLPAASQYGAQQVPVSTAETLSEQALKLMDRIATKPTALDEDITTEIRARFDQRLNAITERGEFSYRLNFREMQDGNNRGIANAFALPSGDIVITDTLIAITTDDELDSIIFHEIGHVVERHGLTAVIRASTMSVVAAMALGDLSTVAELTTGIATFYVQSRYSRGAEAEADDYAMMQLVHQNMDPIHFANAMRKLELHATGIALDDDSDTNDYLSTHPSSRSRIEKAEQRSREFNNQ